MSEDACRFEAAKTPFADMLVALEHLVTGSYWLPELPIVSENLLLLTSVGVALVQQPVHPSRKRSKLELLALRAGDFVPS